MDGHDSNIVAYDMPHAFLGFSISGVRLLQTDWRVPSWKVENTYHPGFKSRSQQVNTNQYVYMSNRYFKLPTITSPGAWQIGSGVPHMLLSFLL